MSMKMPELNAMNIGIGVAIVVALLIAVWMFATPKPSPKKTTERFVDTKKIRRNPTRGNIEDPQDADIIVTNEIPRFV